MNALLLLPQYGHWHYRRGLKDYVLNWRGIHQFLFRFFSFSVLLRTLFVPWKRMSDTPTSEGIDGIFTSLVVSALMRFVGLVIRLCVIGVGTLVSLIVFCICAIGFLIWILFPFVFAFVIAVVIKLLIS